MTELLGIIAAIALTCSGTNTSCGLQPDMRAISAFEQPLPLVVPKPVHKPAHKTASKAKPVIAVSARKQVAQADPVFTPRLVKRKPLPIFIGAYY